MLRGSDGKFIDTRPFRESALRFMVNGFYCDEPWGSDSWYSFWEEERRRCIEGYEVDGVMVTGDHYFYLNYCPIQKVDDSGGKKSRKVKGFPDFWDGDYDYFWSRQIARDGIDKDTYASLGLISDIPQEHLDGGYNLIVGKSRRKGYSFKAAAIAAKNYFTLPNSLTVFAAEDKKYLYPNGIFKMAMDNIHFINMNTAWAMPSDVINKPGQGHIRASYIEYRNGIKIESGFKSEILAVSFGDNPDALRGKDAYDIFFEESGAFGVPGLLKDSYRATEDCVKAGSIKTGLITVFGTSGDMLGGTADYADMFERPEAFGFLPFRNIWEDKPSDDYCGFFHPACLNMEGYYDEQGNSDIEAAKASIKAERQKLIDKGATTTEMQLRLQERPLCPSEAFTSSSINTFPVVELKRQLSRVKAQDKGIVKPIPVELSYDGSEVIAKPIMRGAMPINSIHNLPSDIRGCVVVYEQPSPTAPKGLYKIGYDPVRQDSGTSLASIIVYKGVQMGSFRKNLVVAEYIGRLDTAEDIDRLAEMLAVYYNTTIMHENEVSSVKNYFRRIKRLDLLALQPDRVISKNVKNSKVARVYGCHMNAPLKDAGERYIKEWLLEIADYDEEGTPIRNIDNIYSQRLLEELIAYTRNGNYDAVSALIMCMMQVQEEELGKVYGEKVVHANAQKLLSMMNKMYRNGS